ncbi:MAG: class II fructose-bisphosphate aldolase [Bryobacteraceae bacterium]
MPIASLHKILHDACNGGYGVPYCESWNLESAQAVVAAAERVQSPAIVGFNGGFLQHSARQRPEELVWYAGMRLALESSRVPVALLLNESTTVDQIAEAIRLGFNAVMPENEGLAAEQYEKVVRDTVALAHPKGVWVEAQIGTLPAANGAGHHSTGERTDPGRAAAFVASTSVDALGIAIGNVHVMTKGKASLDFEALKRIREAVEVPLVVHGGTSLTSESLRRMVELGVAKINFGTVLKQAYLETVRHKLACYQPPANPHPYLGMGGEEDIMTAGREAVQRKVEELMRICGSAGRVS